MKRIDLKPISEAEFQEQVVALAKLHGWRVYHAHDSRRSEAGFPDLLLLRGPQVLVAELKVGRGKLTPEQAAWVAAFEAAGVPAYLWRPDDWGVIEEVLTQGVPV